MFRTESSGISSLQSFKLQSNDGILENKPEDFTKYLKTLVNKLDAIRAGTNIFSKEIVYAEIMRLVSNCQRLSLGLDLLVGSKLSKYVHLMYTLLLDINDSKSFGYQNLLPRLNQLRGTCKQNILKMV